MLIKGMLPAFGMLACLGLLIIGTSSGCKPGGSEVTALRLPDSVAVRDNHIGSGSATVPTQPITHKTSSTSGTSSSGVNSMLVDSDNPRLGGGSSSLSSKVRTSKNLWWNKRNIFFADYVGGTGDIVYDAIKGQPFFDNTMIFVYCTDKPQEGTKTYDKVVDSMKSTELDDRIFIWVHLDENRKVVFVKKLISDNIKDTIDQAPNHLE